MRIDINDDDFNLAINKIIAKLELAKQRRGVGAIVSSYEALGLLTSTQSGLIDSLFDAEVFDDKLTTIAVYAIIAIASKSAMNRHNTNSVK